MEKTIALLGLLENGTFYLISRDHNQPIKRPEFNEVLYKCIYNIAFVNSERSLVESALNKWAVVQILKLRKSGY